MTATTMMMTAMTTATTMTTERRRPWRRLTVRQRLTYAVGVLLTLALTGVGVALFILESQRIEQDAKETVRQEVDEFGKFGRNAVDPETSQAFTDPDRMLEAFLERNTPGARELLWAFGTDGSVAFAGPRNTRLNDEDSQARLEDFVGRFSDGGGVDTLQAGDRTYIVAVQPVVQADQQAAFVVTYDLTGARGELRSLLLTFALLAALSVIVVANLSARVVNRLLHPLTALTETAHNINAGELSGRLRVTGHADLSELQRAFNAMLDRLEQAFTSQRELLDDAAHELRTPLTVLQGHLETVDIEDSADVRATRDLLLDEVDRMARLVNDLLLLAKSRRPDFIQARQTDLAELTRGCFQRAVGLADRDWKLDQAVDELIWADPQRLTQAVLQLAHNAVRHTDAGAEIGIGSHAEDGWLEIWVRDTGPGVNPEVKSRLFERFVTGDSGEERGFGLGLSIVQAIAEGHGGHVLLDEVADGATFRIRLPVHGRESEGAQ